MTRLEFAMKWRDGQAVDPQSQCKSEIVNLLHSQGSRKTATVRECALESISGFRARFRAAQRYRYPWLQGAVSKNRGKIEYPADPNRDRAPFPTLRK